MSEPTTDAERIAALLDGRLSAEQRSELLARLASSESERDVLAEAAAILRDIEPGESAGGGKALPLVMPRPRWRFSRARPWLAIAAAVAFIGVIALVRSHGHTPAPRDPGRFVAMLQARDGGAPAGWDDHPWSVSRAAGAVVAPDARAVRIGARVAELELAVRARDSAAARLAAELAALLEPIPASAPAVGIYRQVAGRAGAPPNELAALLARGRVAAASLAGADLVELGAWLETARVAAARHDAAFFREPASRAMLDRAAGLATLPATARQSLRSIESSITASDAHPDWSAVEDALTGVLRTLAG
ncbi:MAG TPA: hypothetical protein VF041_18725 [Gemmatimonadaceae bacterium]